MENDAATVALTGQLPFIVLVGAALAYPLSLWLLNAYRRSVGRIMQKRGGAQPVPHPSAGTPVSAPVGQLEFVRINASRAAKGSPALEPRLARALLAPWVTVRVYAAGGLAYAVVLGTAQLIADGSFSLLRFAVMTCIYAWPIVIATNLILPSTTRLRIRSGGVYFGAVLVLFLIAAMTSSNVSIADLFFSWLLFALPPTILLLLFLNRRVRAIGPLVLTFAILSVAGANVALAVTASSETVLRGVTRIAVAIGANAIAAFFAIIAIGLILFAILGWLATSWIRKRYLDKQLTDQSLTLDATWLLFGAVQSVGLAFVSPAWYSAGFVAFVAYLVATRLGFKWLASSARRRDSSNLLLLRVFALGRRSEPVFDAVSAHWRYLGNVRMIAGPDLAASTIEPHEFLEYLSGRIDRSFIADDRALQEKLQHLDRAPDFDNRYRVNDFFCYEDTWTTVLHDLVAESDVVFMDVRGFSPANSGVAYELNALVNAVSLDRVVLAFDRTTNMSLLHKTLEDSWSTMRPDSPNRKSPNRTISLCEIDPNRPREIRHVLEKLCQAAAR